MGIGKVVELFLIHANEESIEVVKLFVFCESSAALVHYVLRGEYVLFMRESPIKVSHCEHIEEHNEVKRVGKGTHHPLIDLYGTQEELYHKTKQV